MKIDILEGFVRSCRKDCLSLALCTAALVAPPAQAFDCTEPPPRPTPEEWVFQKELSAPEESPAPDVSVDPATGRPRTFWLENRISRLKAKFAGNRERLLDLGVMETLRIQFASARNIFRFYKARDTAVKAAGRGDFAAALEAARTMRGLVAAERGTTAAAIPLCEADGRLGFHSEAESHQFYPARLRWRLEMLDCAVRELDEIDAALAAGRPYPRSEMDAGAPVVEVAADGTIDLAALAGKNRVVLVSTLDETGCRFPFAERVEIAPDGRYKVPDDAARIYIRPDNVSGAPLWPQSRYPRRHRLNLFGVEGRNFGRLLRK